MTRRLIKPDGSETELIGPTSMRDIATMIGADCVDIVALRHLGKPLQVMIVDDRGHDKELPVNVKATELYWANCKPDTEHRIVGACVICYDHDFGNDND